LCRERFSLTKGILNGTAVVDEVLKGDLGLPVDRHINLRACVRACVGSRVQSINGQCQQRASIWRRNAGKRGGVDRIKPSFPDRQPLALDHGQSRVRGLAKTHQHSAEKRTK
jgi:hypothetical protein